MINLKIQTQPTDESCGPTCLHAIYDYYGLNSDLDTLIHHVERTTTGGTLAPFLGKHAIEQGFKTTIYTNNLTIFDPTWFIEASAKNIMAKLSTQIKCRTDPLIIQTSKAYLKYMQAGGAVLFRTLNVQLLKEYFNRKIPVLTGLSATYLYKCARERFTQQGVSIYDDICGTPCGHFVVLCGYDEHKKHIVIADPHRENPLAKDSYYKVNIYRLINAIMLGVLTNDGNLLIIEPQGM